MSELSRKIAEELKLTETAENADGFKMYSNISEETLELLIENIKDKAIAAIKNSSMNSGDEWEQGLVISEDAINEAFEITNPSKKIKP